MKLFDAQPLLGSWHLAPNPYSAIYIPGSGGRKYQRAKLGCLPGDAGHGGRDINADSPDRILRAVWPGTINIYPDSDFGNHLGIYTDDDSEAFYAHFNSIFVRDGQHVEPEQPLGVMGNSGQTTGIHTHFELRTLAGDWCTAIDPTPFLEDVMLMPSLEQIDRLMSARLAEFLGGIGWGSNAPGGFIPDAGSWNTKVRNNNIEDVRGDLAKIKQHLGIA